MQSIIISKGSLNSRIRKAREIIIDLLGKELHPDLHIVSLNDGKRLISIDQAREMMNILYLKPVFSNHKVIWIRESQLLSREAQNSLLKVLEEPPEYALVILTVDHHDNLLPTVRSRCKIVELSSDIDVDFESEEVKRCVEEFMDLVNSDVGKRIDWVTKNRELLKDRFAVVDLLKIWELVLRDLLLLSVSSSGDQSIANFEIVRSRVRKYPVGATSWMSSLRYLQLVSRAIAQNNANAMLGIESFLINLPV